MALAAEPSAWRYGYELSKELGIKAGSMYPILMRLTDRGLLEMCWEAVAPGLPARRFYRLTGDGRELAATLAKAAAVPVRPRPEPT